MLIEDNEDDVFIMRRAMRNLGSPPMYVAKDGREALNYLKIIGTYDDQKLFQTLSVIFLDLKLPLMHGFEVLAWIKQQPLLKDIPVAILTSSPEERDRRRAEELEPSKVKIWAKEGFQSRTGMNCICPHLRLR